MSDFNSSQPVRTETNGDVVVKIVDGTTPSQALAVDSSGRIVVKLDDGAGNAITSQANGGQRALDVGINVSGTQIDPRSIRALTATDVVTANIGTTGGLALNTSVTALQVAQGSATSGQSGTLVQGAVTTAAPAYTTAQTSPLSLTTAGALRVDGSAVTQPVSGTVAATQSGTWTVQPGNTANTTAWLVKDVSDGSISGGTAGSFSMLSGLIFNTAAPTLTTGQQASLQGDASANLLVKINAALPTGSNTIGAVTQASGPWTVTGTGTAGTPASGVVTIQGISGGTAIPISGTVTATNPSVSATGATPPASATYMGGSVTTAAPAYTTGQMSALSLTTSGLLRVDGSGVTQPVSGTVAATQSGTWTVQPGNTQNTTAWLTQDAADGPVTPGTVAGKSILTGGQFNSSAPTLTTGQQAALQVNSSGALKVDGSAVTQPVSGTVTAKVTDATGTAFSTSNPLPVTVTSTLPGTAINDYNTASAIAAAATSNHDYSVTSTKTFLGKKFWASASGKLKAEVQISPDGTTFTTRWVGFNSTSNPNISIDLDLLSISDTGAGAKIRIIRTNLDKQAMDVYSTISGTEQ